MTETRLSNVLARRAVDRRDFLSRAAGLAAAAATPGVLTARRESRPARRAAGGGAAPTLFAYVGCFSGGGRNARGEGISVYRVGPDPDEWLLVQLLQDRTSPSFLVRDPKRPLLYAVHERAGQASVLRVDPRSGELALVNQVATGGLNPTHLALDPTGRFLVIANYGGGSVSVVPVLADGSLGARSHLVALEGALGPHKTEQSTPHPHQCCFDPSGRHVAVPDKGLDRVFMFRLDPATGRLQAADPPSVAARSGAGPRHLGFHPAAPFAYVINELDSTVAVLRLEAASGALTPIQVVPSVPSSFAGPNTGAAIEVSRSGRYVYASNRGHDSIVVFAVDPQQGTLTPRGWTSTGGRVPRFFCIDPSGTRVYAANQGSDTIVSCRLNPSSGELTPTGRVIQSGSPTSIAFGPAG